MAPSRYDWKIVDWDVKPQHNQPTNLRLHYVVLKILKANMNFWTNSRCRIENSVEKAAVFLLPMYIIGLKIVPRDSDWYAEMSTTNPFSN